MKSIIYNNKPYNVPESWSDVNVGMVVKASELSELLEEAPIIAIMSAYTGIPVQELKADRSTEVMAIMSILDFISTPYEPQPQTSFTLNGIEYSCESDLLNQRFEDWVSIQTAMYNNRENPENALPKLLAILCKRDKESLDDFDLNERTKLMQSLEITKAKDVEAFFLSSLNAYRGIILLSSTTKEQEALVLNKVSELQNTLKKHKAHSGTSFGWRIRIGYYQIVLWWVKKQLEKYFNTTPSEQPKKTLKQTFKKLLTKILKKDKSNGDNNDKL